MIYKLGNITALVILLGIVPVLVSAATAVDVINVSLSSSRVKAGETVQIRVPSIKSGAVRAVLLKPTVGTEPLNLKPVASDEYRGEVHLSSDAPEGLYVIHVWTGESSNPSSVGKASFLSGRIINDFFIASYVDAAQPAPDIDAYLKEFRMIGGNTLIAHNLISPTKAFYASRIIKTDLQESSPNDLVELILNRADRHGIAVLLSVSWDMTKQSPFANRMTEIKAIATELYELYKHHPSLAGFYSYQEGSGTYYVPFVREFSQFIKTLNPNLLTACAPHVDDPLLAGYLATVEDLDVIIYQAGVMASYRTDNRKKYPFRRVKDFCALGAGAKLLQNKIAINHVELFGYLENRLNPQTTATTYENIYSQILSAATVTNADGISFFTFHAHVHDALKKQPGVGRSRAAVTDGIRAFDLIASQISNARNPLVVYFPYSDWIIERWPNYFLPALDAFRVLGVPVDVLPYAPPLEESVYPYYPFHLNKDVLARLLSERTVLVLPNVSGFQQTDSDLIKSFVEQGGVVIAFGPQIPMGRSYEREKLFGIDEGGTTSAHVELVVRDEGGYRVKRGTRFALGQLELSSWINKGARTVASFADGSPAITINKYGLGTAIAVLPDASIAAQKVPELVRDVLDYAVSLRGGSPVVDVVGTNENCDVAVARTPSGFRVAVVNYNEKELEVTMRPARMQRASDWIDLATNRELGNGFAMKVKIPGGGFRAIESR